jgi:hypothetical protein
LIESNNKIKIFKFTYHKFILWFIDPFLCKELKTNNETKAVAMQQHSKHVSTTKSYLWKRYFLIGPWKGVVRKKVGVAQLVESQPMKRRLGEMAASLGIRQLSVES